MRARYPRIFFLVLLITVNPGMAFQRQPILRDSGAVSPLIFLENKNAPDKPGPSADAPFAGMFRSHRDTHMNAFDFDAVHADPDTMAGSRLKRPQ